MNNPSQEAGPEAAAMSLCSEMTWLPRAYLPAPVQLPADDDVSRAYEAAARRGPSSSVIRGMLSIPSRPSLDSEVSEDQCALGRSRSDAGALPEQEIVVFPSGRKHSHWAVSLRPPTRDVNLLGHCRSNRFLGCYSSHLPRQSCGATRTQDVSRPASAISSGLGAMNGQIRSVNADRPQATVPATNHESPEEEDVADTATPDGLPVGCQVRTMMRC